MNALRVLTTKVFFANDLDYLRSEFLPEVELIEPREFTAEAVAIAAQEDIDVLLGELVTKDILENARRLRMIQVPWTGVDRLDFDLLKQYKIPVCNSHSNDRVVAEMAVGLLLAIMKKIPLHDSRLRRGQWMRPQRDVAAGHFPPSLLSGKTVGYIGYGAIAQQISKLLLGFDLKFLATAARVKQPLPLPLSAMYSPENQCELARQCDVVIVTAPLVPATRGLIDAKFFTAMRRSAYILNVSRGEVVDEQALFTALETRQIAGAAVDTWYQYPTAQRPQALPSARFPFHELDNLVLSPHRAGFVDGDLPHLADVVDNINRLATGRPLINRIDLDRGF